VAVVVLVRVLGGLGVAAAILIADCCWLMLVDVGDCWLFGCC
jgi:hypothetical protein